MLLPRCTLLEDVLFRCKWLYVVLVVLGGCMSSLSMLYEAEPAFRWFR